ncbi:MAG: UDP-N-acetylmuramoyl-tripeptide--D-alanyl-D-alanine ligase [Fimbriimonadaceae bacterium]|nr:UDP-N-acetylmuramoyl-tripeptide--D-alanyl-D-alanine ligase [Fimbriimonadaceae bacterium]
MKPLATDELADIVHGRLVGIPPKSPVRVTGFATDQREVKPGDLFIAIEGAKVDGHEFAAKAIANGAAAVLAERPVDGPHLLVERVTEALALFGNHFRDRFSGPVIGITGSAGKTTSKEFLSGAISPLGPILKTQGNRNTEYTAPLLWAELQSDTAAVVVEMAMRGPGQIAHLASFSRPTIGLITNIGWSHLSEVGSRLGIAKAKCELIDALPNRGIAILPADDEFFQVMAGHAGERQIYTFGWSNECDCRLVSAQPLGWESTEITGFFADIPWRAEIQTLGRHIASNVAAAICGAAALGLAPQEAADGLSDVELPPMRMQVLERNGVKVLLDAYNASPASMAGAIETFATLPCEGKRFAILGQMNELGDESARAHRELASLVQSMHLDSVATFGPLWREYGLQEPVESIAELRKLFADLEPGDAILIKGSRSLELEKVLE